jgi:hypothetical protein
MRLKNKKNQENDKKKIQKKTTIKKMMTKYNQRIKTKFKGKQN